MNETVVTLDCCCAGLAINGRVEGRKEVFAACSGSEIAANDSFTDLLVRPFVNLEDDGGRDLSIADWVRETSMLAIEYECVVPVYEAPGIAGQQIRLKPRTWMERKALRATFSRIARGVLAEERRRRLLDAVVELRLDLMSLGQVTEEETLTYEEWTQILTGDTLTEPFDQIQIFRAIMRIRKFGSGTCFVACLYRETSETPQGIEHQ